MENWIAIALAVISPVLLVGWQWLKQKLTSAGWLKQRWLGRTAEFFYFVGLPYLALVFGVLTPQRLGLKGLEYFSLISPNAIFADLQRIFALLLVEWLVDVGPMLGLGFITAFILGGIIFVLVRYGVPEAQSSETILYTIYYTLHWAFYWALFWLLLDNLYLGILIGSSWVILEWWLVARMQQTQFGEHPQQLVEIMILILTATIFFYRPNLWLLWPIHLTLVFLTRLTCTAVTKTKRSENSL